MIAGVVLAVCVVVAIAAIAGGSSSDSQAAGWTCSELQDTEAREAWIENAVPDLDEQFRHEAQYRGPDNLRRDIAANLQAACDGAANEEFLPGDAVYESLINYYGRE